MTTTLPSATPDAYGTEPGDPIRARTIGGVGELIDLSHWVGALITGAATIGTRGVARSVRSSTKPPR